jgi:hypothetical protein
MVGSQVAISRTRRGTPSSHGTLVAASGKPGCLGTPPGTRATSGTLGATPTPTSGILATSGTLGTLGTLACGSPPATPPRRATMAATRRPTPTALQRTMRPRPQRPTSASLAATAGATALARTAPTARPASSLHALETLARLWTALVTLGAFTLSYFVMHLHHAPSATATFRCNCGHGCRPAV